MAGINIYNTKNSPLTFRASNTFAFVGDSRLLTMTDGGSAAYPTNLAHVKANTNFFNWANALSGQRMKIAYNGAISGYRSDQYLNVNNYTTTTGGVPYTAGCGINYAIASGAKWLVVYGVVNDIGLTPTVNPSTGVTDTAATIFARIKAAALQAVAAGMNVILFTEPGSTSMSGDTGQKTIIYQYNQLLREFTDGTQGQGIFLFDIANYQLDPTTVSLAFRSGYMTDATHLNAFGSYYIGAQFASFISTFIPPLNRQIYTPNEVFANGNIQQIINPMFITTTGGTSNAGITGATPANFVTSVTGTGAATISVGADSGGYGNAITFTGTFGAAGDTIQIKQDTTFANYTVPGDIFESGCQVVLSAGATNLSGLALNSSTFGGDANPMADLFPASTTVNLPNVAMDLTLQSVPYTIKTGTSAVSWALKFTGSGVGGFTAVLKRPWLRRRYAL